MHKVPVARPLPLGGGAGDSQYPPARAFSGPQERAPWAGGPHPSIRLEHKLHAGPNDTRHVMQPSPRMRRAAAAELDRIAAHRQRLQLRIEAAQAQLAVLQAQRQELEEAAQACERLTDGTVSAPRNPPPARTPDAPDAPPTAGSVLAGAAVRRAAVRCLIDRYGPNPPAVHYRDWHQVLRDAGLHVAGRDPVAVLLTQISRHPAVRRTTHPGVYELDAGAPARLKRELLATQDRLRGVNTQIAAQGIPTPRQRATRRALEADIRRGESRLLEARTDLLTLDREGASCGA